MAGRVDIQIKKIMQQKQHCFKINKQNIRKKIVILLTPIKPEAIKFGRNFFTSIPKTSKN